MMGRDHSALEPLNPQYSSQSPVMAHNNSTSFSQQQAYNTQPNDKAQSQQLLLGPSNSMAICPRCNTNIKTSIEYSVTTSTHRTATACCPFCCCCLPYCMNSARNVDHYCPNCKAYLGTYRR